MKLTQNLMKVFSLLFFAMFLMSFLYLSSDETYSAENTGTLKAAVVKADITPEEPVYLYGYRSRKTPSEGVHDPISARITAFENNGKRLVIVSTDIGSYGPDAFKDIQELILDKYNLEASQLFLSAIHSHSTPILMLKAEEERKNNVTYTKNLKEKLVKAVGEALDNMQVVHTGTGVGSSPVGSNRREQKPDGEITLGRNPYGPTDKEVLVMKLAYPEGKTVGVIFDYATHATSLGPKNMRVSGDVLGISEQYVEKVLGNDIIAPAFAGASGNIDPWYRVLPSFNTENGRIPETVLLGQMLGTEVLNVYDHIKDLKPGGEINYSFATLECPRKKLEDDTSGNNPSRMREESNTVPVNITVARVGDVAFVGVNVEMITQIGIEIKKGSPFKNTFIITHCNGSSGYLAPAELYKEGGYEIRSTPFEIGSSDMVVAKALRMLYDL